MSGFPKKVTFEDKQSGTPLSDPNKQLSAQEVNDLKKAVNDNALFYDVHPDLATLQTKHPNPPKGAFAYIGDGKGYRSTGNGWKPDVAADMEIKFQYLEKTVQSISAGEGGKMYDTLADAQALATKPQDGTVFQVSEKTDAENAGVYTFQSAETGGTRFERKPSNVDKDDLNTGIYQNIIHPDRNGILFNGINAEAALDREYLLSADGDYIEFKLKNLDFSSLGRFGIFGNKNGGNVQDIAIDRSGSTTFTYSLRIRGNNSTWTDFIISENYYKNVYRVELTNSGASLNLYENGRLISTKSFAGEFLSIINICNSYSSYFANIMLNHFSISSTSSGSISSINEFSQRATFKNTSVVEEVKGFSDMYVSLDLAASSTGHERFTVYSRNEKTNEYLGFFIDHEIDNSDLIYKDQWRIAGAEFFTFDGFQMTPTGSKALTGGESESVYKRAGKDDFSGGYHGDEQVTEARFYIDNIKINASEMVNFNLSPCKEFSYLQISTVHTAPTGGVFASGHPIEAIRHKRTDIKDLGYDTSIRYIWQIPINDFESFFMSLSSVDKFIGQYGENAFLHNVKFFEQGDYVLNSTGKWMRQYSKPNKTAVTIEVESSINDSISELKIWDVSNYHKFYRDINPNRDLSVNTDDVIEGKTRVRFFKR